MKTEKRRDARTKAWTTLTLKSGRCETGKKQPERQEDQEDIVSQKPNNEITSKRNEIIHVKRRC